MAATSQNRYYVLFLLTLVYTFNFIDRQILGILGPLIKVDLGISDGQLGLLTGFYFAVFYTVVGIPIAWLADRYNRVSIVSIALALWSGFTALSGVAGNYLHLALARMGVGFGEAGGSPPSHSILSDLFDKSERSRALAIYSLGIPLGIMAAYFTTAFLLSGGSLNWRIVFIAVGVPGILLALLLKLTVREPVRGSAEGRKVDAPDAARVSVPAAITHLVKIKSWVGMCLGIALSSFGGYALSAFAVVYLRQAFPDFSFIELLIWLGIINGIIYAAGTYIGGWVCDHYGKTDRAAYARIPAIALLIGAPILIGGFWIDNIVVVLLTFSVYLFLAGFYLGPSFSIAQTLAPVSMRSMSTALFFFILNLVALGGGPTVVGFLSDYFAVNHGPEMGLRLALTSLVVPYALSILAFWWTSLHLKADWQAAEGQNSAS